MRAATGALPQLLASNARSLSNHQLEGNTKFRAINHAPLYLGWVYETSMHLDDEAPPEN